MADNEMQFESDIQLWLCDKKGGWEISTDMGYRKGFQYDNEGILKENFALDIDTLCSFVKNTQPVAWALFEKRCKSDPQRKFYKAFQNAVDMDGKLYIRSANSTLDGYIESGSRDVDRYCGEIQEAVRKRYGREVEVVLKSSHEKGGKLYGISVDDILKDTSKINVSVEVSEDF